VRVRSGVASNAPHRAVPPRAWGRRDRRLHIFLELRHGVNHRRGRNPCGRHLSEKASPSTAVHPDWTTSSMRDARAKRTPSRAGARRKRGTGRGDRRWMQPERAPSSTASHRTISPLRVTREGTHGQFGRLILTGNPRAFSS
jgi:hypothetical protein